MKKICVTGANGFIGKSVCEVLSKSNKSVRAVTRDLNVCKNSSNIEYRVISDINDKTNWKQVLVDIDCIIHCAGRAHIMNETKKDELKIYRSVNVDGTKNLVEQAVKAGVKRIVFLSSVKVNGENTNNKFSDTNLKKAKKNIFTYNDIPDPKDPYALSKFEAEKVLWEVSLNTGLDITVVRLPLVYGKGVKGNLERLIKLVKSQIPLPLGLVKNQRSMIGIDNLVDLLIRCTNHPDAAGKTFLVSDDEDISTPDFVRYIATSMGLKALLFPVPIFLIKILGFIFGKKNEINRLIGSLRVDITYTKQILNWTPPVSAAEGIKQMFKDK